MILRQDEQKPDAADSIPPFLVCKTRAQNYTKDISYLKESAISEETW